MDHSVVCVHVSMCMHACVNDPGRIIAVYKVGNEIWGASKWGERSIQKKNEGQETRNTKVAWLTLKELYYFIF